MTPSLAKGGVLPAENRFLERYDPPWDTGEVLHAENQILECYDRPLGPSGGFTRRKYIFEASQKNPKTK